MDGPLLVHCSTDKHLLPLGVEVAPPPDQFGFNLPFDVIKMS